MGGSEVKTEEQMGEQNPFFGLIVWWLISYLRKSKPEALHA